ncbi:MAG: cyclic nucleotide-binding domain-containing protein [Acidobacteriota bacterium]|nr:cyclic nucleotide-binding domain-containing protein [Acidobacteriota bacterium]
MFSKLFGRKPRHPDAETALARGDFSEAIEHYRRLLAQEPREAATWHRRIGETLALAGRRQPALDALWEGAELLEDQGRMLEALAVYQCVLRIDPEDATLEERLQEMAADGATGMGASGPVTLSTHFRRRAPLFSDFSRDELAAIVEMMTVDHLETGRTVFRRGEPADRLFLVARGEVALTAHGTSGHPMERCRVHEGEPFGYVCAKERPVCKATAITSRASELIELSREALDVVAASHPRVWTVLERFQGSFSPVIGG